MFLSEHDNCRTSKHRMMKLDGGYIGRCIVQKCPPSSNLGVIAPWVRTTKNLAFAYDVGKISTGCLLVTFKVSGDLNANASEIHSSITINIGPTYSISNISFHLLVLAYCVISPPQVGERNIANNLSVYV